jgi:excisionase family DNA binding protein
MIAPDEAATLAGISSRTVYRWVETQSIHFTETHDGLLLICLDSLHRSIREVAKHPIT